MGNIKISIVIPSYKAEKYISRAIDSIMLQKNIIPEIVVVIDGILDNTEKILKKYDNKIKTIVFPQNQGAQIARNTGLKSITSNYVMFLDSDDYLEGDLYLYSLWKSMEENNASIAFGPCKFTGENYPTILRYPSMQETCEDVIYRWLLGKSGPNPSCILWRKNEVIRIGAWNESIKKNQDGEIILRAMINSCKVSASQVGFGVYWQYASNNRVSKKISPEAYKSQEEIEQLVTHSLKADKFNKKRIISALEHFRLITSLKAYNDSMPELGIKWSTKWKKDINLTIFKSYPLSRKIYCILVILLGFSKTAYCVEKYRSFKNKICFLFQ